MSIRKSFLGRIASMLILFAMVPTVFLLVSLLVYNRDSSKTSAIYRAERELNEIQTDFTVLVTNIENTASVLASDQTLQRVSKLLRRGATIGQEIDGYKDMCEVISLASIVDCVGEIRVYLPDSRLITRQKMNIFGLSDLAGVRLPKKMTETSLINSGWTKNDAGGITFFYRVVYTPMNNTVIALDMPLDRLAGLFSDVKGRFLIHYAGEALFACGEGGGDVRRLLTVGDWTIEAQISSAPYEKETIHTAALLTGMLSAMLLVIPAVAYLFSRSISRTVNELARANVALTRREYQHIDEKSAVRELLLLQKTHNQMVDSIQEMIQNVYEARHARDQAELTCLFEQVKPHFLYNTLEGGKWLAIQEGGARTAKFLEKLSGFYRIGLSQGSAFVLLSSELEHIRQYVDLMNLRYSDKILLAIHNGCEENPPMVLKLILQPLVENAIEHGLHITGRDGRIDISIAIQGDTLTIDVGDTGAGMPEPLLQKLNAGESCGYGLDNVRRRLAVYYGQNASLRAENKPEGGLLVRVTLCVSKAERAGNFVDAREHGEDPLLTRKTE